MSLTTGLVLYIKNDELSGTVANDSSGTGNNGTLINRNYSTDSVTGQINRALTFTGNVIQAIRIINDTSLQELTSALTISAWINLDGSGGNNGIIEKTITGAANKQFLLFINSSNKCVFRLIKNSSSFSIEANAAHISGQWIHVLCTWNGTTMKMYIDNVLQTVETSVAFPIDSGAGNTFIGVLGSGSFPMSGLIDEVALWNRELDTTERTNLFNFGNGGNSFINTPPTGAVISALQRDVDGAIVDITFNLIDDDSNNVTVTLKGSDTGDFTGEEKVLTPLTTDLLHTLFTGTPLTTTPTGIEYHFVWDAENEYANGFEGIIHLKFFLDDQVDPAVVSFSSFALSVTYEDLVGDEGEQELELWQTEDPALAAVSTLTEPFNLGEVLRNARTSGTVLTDHQIRTLNVWRDNDIGLFNVGTQLQPFRFGDVLVELLGSPPFTTTLTQEEINDLNDWANNDASLARVSTLSEPFMLGDVLNTLLTRKF